MSELNFLAGGGAMGARMRGVDWAATSLGVPNGWPLSLKTIVRIALDSRFAIWFAWGPELIFFCNDAYAPTLGIKQDWALGASARQVWAEIWPDIGPRIDVVLQTGQATWDEGLLLYLERSGVREETYHTFSYSPLPDDSGRVGGMLCVVTEETSRLINERRVVLLRDLAGQLATARTEDAVFTGVANVLSRDARDIPFSAVYLSDGNEVKAQPAVTTGLAQDPLAAQWSVLEVIASDGELQHLPVLPSSLCQMVEGSDEAARSALVVPLAQGGQDGSKGAVVFGLNPYRPFDAAYEGFLKLFVGQVAAALSSVRSFEAERRRAEELARLDRAKTTFFSNVSHELRTPLTLMLGPTESALESDGALAGEDLLLVSRNQRRLLKLVNSLLDFARIEAGRVQAEVQAVDLAALTRDIASGFRSATERAGLTLEVDAPALQHPVWVDADMWEKIVLNLVSNALKYTRSGGIAVSLRARGDKAVLQVRDTGIGIAPADQKRLFERFFRVEGARGRSHEGTGIGLALVKELVRFHDGEIEVASAPGEGSTFTVSVPLTSSGAIAPAPAGEHRRSGVAAAYVAEALGWLGAEAETPGALATGATRHRILLADDNADMRAYLQRLLSEHWEIRTVTDGQAALEALQEWSADLVISDVMMPGLDGFGLLKVLRAQPQTSTLPILLLSARAGEEARLEGLGAGADDYLVKPFSARELIVRVASLLALSQARRQANEREMRLRAETSNVLESIHEGFISFDDQWRVVYMNKAAEDTFAQERSALLGKNFWELMPQASETEGGKTLMRCMEDRQHRRFESYYPPWGRWFDNLVYPHGTGVCSYFRDITESKRAMQQLQEADRRKDEFLATLAHELRNPLAPLRTAASILASPKLQDKHISSVQDILARQVGHMARLLDDLLDVSRITLGRMELRKAPVALTGLLDGAVAAVQTQMDAQGHSLVVAPPGKDVSVRVDSVRIEQVLVNLLTNAAKYTDAGGHITLRAKAVDDGIVLEVEDDGVGLAIDQQPLVFEMFTQVSDSIARSQGGLGIGLALVKGIVELHGGTVSVHSPGPGQGCRFTVSIPNCVVGEKQTTSIEQQADVRRGRARRILVADDNVDAAQTLALLLRMEGHEVTVANDGHEALSSAANVAPDIALLDIGMPGLTGYEVAQQLRRLSNAPMKIVAVTGWGQPSDLERAYAAGFDHHLVKPADVATILQLVEGLRS